MISTHDFVRDALDSTPSIRAALSRVPRSDLNDLVNVLAGMVDDAAPPADAELLASANRTLAAEVERLRRVLAVEQGDASAAPEGWRPSVGEAWAGDARDSEHYVYRITRGRWDWVSRSSRGKVYGRGVAPTALEAMEAADRAALGVSDV